MSISRFLWWSIAASGLSLFTAGVARSQDSGPYVGMAVGLVDTPKNSILNLGDVHLTGNDRDNHDVTFEVLGGYRFGRYFAIEGGYIDLGESSGKLTGGSATTAAQADVGFSMRGATLAAVGLLPLGNWEPYLKVGVIFARTKLSVAGTYGDEDFSARFDGKSEDAFFSLGTNYKLAQQWRASLAASFYQEVGEPHKSGASDAGTFTLGLTYSF
jgi:OOP family OmpA-OmpF porin